MSADRTVDNARAVELIERLGDLPRDTFDVVRELVEHGHREGYRVGYGNGWHDAGGFDLERSVEPFDDDPTGDAFGEWFADRAGEVVP